eukprot:692169-Prymnesium_polylepis.1
MATLPSWFEEQVSAGRLCQPDHPQTTTMPQHTPRRQSDRSVVHAAPQTLFALESSFVEAQMASVTGRRHDRPEAVFAH